MTYGLYKSIFCQFVITKGEKQSQSIQLMEQELLVMNKRVKSKKDIRDLTDNDNQGYGLNVGNGNRYHHVLNNLKSHQTYSWMILLLKWNYI